MILPNAPISDAIKCINSTGGEIALVVDESNRLIGTITDGDIRRGLLRGIGLADPASEVMNTSPRTASVNATAGAIRLQMELAKIRQIPLLNEQGLVVDLVLLSAVNQRPLLPNIIVLMAGGRGERLLPLTESVPKPMLQVGDRPILQRIVEQFVSAGFRRFVISLNYLGEQIESHFGDGSRFGAEIIYLRETTRLGTAGALSLLPIAPADPFFVMNADILTSVDVGAMLKFHEASRADATMAVNSFHFNVPYGVAEVSGDRIVGLREKPRFDFFVNSGIYILNPDVLKHVPADAAFDMPSLFEKVIAVGGATCAFPIHEEWVDIGQPEDFKRAENQVASVIRSSPVNLR